MRVKRTNAFYIMQTDPDIMTNYAQSYSSIGIIPRKEARWVVIRNNQYYIFENIGSWQQILYTLHLHSTYKKKYETWKTLSNLCFAIYASASLFGSGRVNSSMGSKQDQYRS